MIATCIKTDPLQTLEVGKGYEIEQYNDKFIVKWAGMVISKEVFNEHFEVKGGQDDNT